MVSRKLKLKVYWNHKENDFMISYPRKADGHFAHYHIISKRIISMLKSDSDAKDPKYSFRDEAAWNKNFAYFDFDWIKALEERGFDLKTLKFEITIDKNKLTSNFGHIWEELTEKEKKSAKKLGFK